MDTASLRRRIERLIHTPSEVYVPAILNSGFSCTRCGWCCRENFKIRITQEILRPSNAISIFPEDIRRIIRGKGLRWDEVAQPDIYSCLFDGGSVWAIGWILRRNAAGECIFYRKGTCTVYEHRPMICRCYPFFMDEQGVDIMRCQGLGNKITVNSAVEMGKLLKLYEIKKLQSYIRIIGQIGDKLDFTKLHSLSQDHSGIVHVCDGEAISLRRL